MSPQLVAALPMYDFPSLRAAHDALWRALASRLNALGVDGVPEQLSYDLGHLQLWAHEGLLFGQACEYPISRSFADRVRLLATPPFRVGSVAWQEQPGQWTLTVVCKATYALEPPVAPLAREPEDVVGPAIFLASAASDYVTGVQLPVDGGYSVTERFIHP